MYPYFFVLCPIFPVLFFLEEEEEEEATKGSGCQKAENQKNKKRRGLFCLRPKMGIRTSTVAYHTIRRIFTIQNTSSLFIE